MVNGGHHSMYVCKLWQRLIAVMGMTINKQNMPSLFSWPVRIVENRSLGYHQCVEKCSSGRHVLSTLYTLYTSTVLVNHNAFKIFIDLGNKFAMIYLNNTFPGCTSKHSTMFNGRIKFHLDNDYIGRSMSNYIDGDIALSISDNVIYQNRNVYYGGEVFGRNGTNIRIGFYYLCEK